MSAAAVIQTDAGCSRHFHTILGALLNASNDDYEDRLMEVLDYVAACENNANLTAMQTSVVWAIRSKEKERTALRKQLAKLTRFNEHGQHEEMGDWLSFYDVMAVVK